MRPCRPGRRESPHCFHAKPGCGGAIVPAQGRRPSAFWPARWKDFFVKFPEMRAYELNLEGKDGKSAEEQLQEALEPMLRPEGEWEKPTDG